MPLAIVTATEMMEPLEEDDNASSDTRRRRPSMSPLLTPTRSPKSKYARATTSEELLAEADEMQQSERRSSDAGESSSFQEPQTPTSPEPLLPGGTLVLPAPLIRVSTDEVGRRRCHPSSVFHHLCCSCRTTVRLCCGCTWCTWCWCALLAPALPLLMSRPSDQPHAWDFLWMDPNTTLLPPAAPPGGGWG
tara:strand:+ start:255 stop:827 length:573 start_codon:yes stop_codon:yes gene_type:complete